jgi:hypothetical protein
MTTPSNAFPINKLHQEPGAHELTSSENMEPYLRIIMAEMEGADPTPQLEALRQLPLERRYIWRVVSALKWALADCETDNVNADRETLSADDLARVMELLRLRPMQFCIFLKALVGAEEMQRMMVEAIRVAKQI